MQSMAGSDTMHRLTTPAGELQLKRYPAAQDPSLKAWDAADQWLIERAYSSLPKGERILIINDEFGALTTALSADFDIIHWSDSRVSQLAAEKNLRRNAIRQPQFVPATELPGSHQQSAFRLFIVRPPKTLRLLQFQLNWLSQHFGGCEVWVATMQKHITSGLKQCLANYLAELNPGRSERKARIISGYLRSAPCPKLPSFHYYEHQGVVLANMANVFSAESIDIGARFFIEQFERLPDAEHIADLGCGNGALAAFAKRFNPSAKITGFDESYMAIASAKETFRINALTDGEFKVSNLLNEAKDASFDLILCNPPFHQQRRVTTDTARMMIKQAYHKLTNGGHLWLVANRHLNYFNNLKRTFGNATTLSANPKFVVLGAQKQTP
jgi:16S rRNA G1207 methylase RsmC